MDYLDHVAISRHPSFSEFESWRRREKRRLVLFSTRAERSYLDMNYRAGDVLLFGRESAGVPDGVFAAADERVKIPMTARLRSINVAMAVAMAIGEALRQTRVEASPPA